MKGFNEGHIASLDGARIIIAKCQDVSRNVVVRNGVTQCFEDIPVLYNEEPFFWVSKSKTIVKESVEIDCVESKTFKIGEAYYRQSPPKLVLIEAPQKLDPNFINDNDDSNTDFLSSYIDLKSITGDKLNEVVPSVLSYWERVTFPFKKKLENGMYYTSQHPESHKNLAMNYRNFLSGFSGSLKTFADWAARNFTIIGWIGLAVLLTIPIVALFGGCFRICFKVGCRLKLRLAKKLFGIFFKFLLIIWDYFIFWANKFVDDEVEEEQLQLKSGKTNSGFDWFQNGNADDDVESQNHELS